MLKYERWNKYVYKELEDIEVQTKVVNMRNRKCFCCCCVFPVLTVPRIPTESKCGKNIIGGHSAQGGSKKNPLITVTRQSEGGNCKNKHYAGVLFAGTWPTSYMRIYDDKRQVEVTQ